MSRQELADGANKYLYDQDRPQASLSANYIGKLERGLHRWPHRDYREALRKVLSASTNRELGFFITRRSRGRSDDESLGAAGCFRAVHLAESRFAAIPIGAPPRAGRETCPAALRDDGPGTATFFDGAGLIGDTSTSSTSDEFRLSAPAGRFFGGAAIDVQVHLAEHDGRIVATMPARYGQDAFLLRPRRALVAGVVDGHTGARVYAMDSRRVRQHLATAGDQTRLTVPQAYALDEVTLGLLWAVANLDEALLNDDRAIASTQEQLVPYERLPRSAVSRDLVNDVTPASAMWLGSQFCARHIFRNLDDVDDVPLFWTREQHGEEASTWLLFAHKYEYLRSLAARFPDGMARAFCIPAEAAEASPPAERILLVLAASLMESFGIRVQVVSDPAYETVDGFVLDAQRRAIIANWVRADGVWHVDTTTSRPALRQYADAADHASAHSVIGTGTPAHRLRALSDYLRLDWTRLIRRCAELADYGAEGIAPPRSRLLSIAGVDRACRHLGQLAQTGS